MKAASQADGQQRFAEILDVLREERQLARRRKDHEEISEGIRQLEAAIVRVESDERARLLALQHELQSTKQLAALFGDFEREKRSCSRRVNKLKKLRVELQTVTGKGMQAAAVVQRLEDELKWLRSGSLETEATLFVAGRISQVEKWINETRRQVETLRKSYIDLETQIAELSASEKELWKIEKSMAECRKAQRRADELTTEMEKLKTSISRNYHVKREQTALEDLKQKLAENGYDADHHERLLARVYTFMESELAPSVDSSRTGG